MSCHFSMVRRSNSGRRSAAASTATRQTWPPDSGCSRVPHAWTGCATSSFSDQPTSADETLSSGSWLPDLSSSGSSTLPYVHDHGQIGTGGALSSGSGLPDLSSQERSSLPPDREHGQIGSGSMLSSGSSLPGLSPGSSTLPPGRDHGQSGNGGMLSSGSWLPDLPSQGCAIVADCDPDAIGVGTGAWSHGQSGNGGTLSSGSWLPDLSPIPTQIDRTRVPCRAHCRGES